MKESYLPYSGKHRIGRGEVGKLIDEFNRAIKDSKFQRHKQIVDMVPAAGGVVLDYGCGWGCISRAVAEKGNKVIGIDQFEGALEVARDFNSHKDVEFKNTKINDFDSEMFDVVISSQVLEHVHNPGIYLRNINRVLKTGGILVISVPNVINLFFLWQQLKKAQSALFSKISCRVLENYSKDSDHIQSWDPKTFVALHASVGFGYVEHRYLEGMYLPYGQYKHVTVPWGGRYFHTKNIRLRNLSYTMVFKFRKLKYVEISPED